MYHLVSYGQAERAKKIIEDMLRTYVIDQPSKWKYYINLVEFAYNNGYHELLKMSQFEALYGRKCNTPVSWDEPVDIVVIGPDSLKEMEEQMIKTNQNLKASHDMHKSYSNKNKLFHRF
jgi:hypothetical protein